MEYNLLIFQINQLISCYLYAIVLIFMLSDESFTNTILINSSSYILSG